MTSSARSRIAVGSSMPIALAVFRYSGRWCPLTIALFDRKLQEREPRGVPEAKALKYSAKSALPPKADKEQTYRNVCFVPKADSRTAAKQHLYSITASPRASS